MINALHSWDLSPIYFLQFSKILFILLFYLIKSRTNSQQYQEMCFTKKSKQKFGEFKYFGGSDVANKLNGIFITYLTLKLQGSRYNSKMIIKFRWVYIDFLKVILYKNRVFDKFFLLMPLFCP